MHESFKVHMLNDRGKEKARRIAEGFDELLTDLQQVCPEGRSLSIVRTKLEEACFFAKRAMASEPENQE